METTGGDETIVDAERGVEYGLAKHQWTIAERGFGFDAAARVWEGRYVTYPGKPKDDEQRSVTIGTIESQKLPIAVVWTQRGVRRRILSARVASRKERKLL